MNLQSFFRVLFFLPRPVGGGGAPNGDPSCADAQFVLGRRYDEGDEPDFQQAMECYRKAAQQGHAAAQFNLGQMYAHGRGVPRDDAAALNWIRKAADGGNAAAQHDLGARCHRASLHVRRVDFSEDRIEAYKWLYLAAAQHYHGSAVACERVTISMSSEEVMQGNQRANTFVPRVAGTGKDRPGGARESLGNGLTTQAPE
jgi:TPR repeat protein